MKTYRWPSEKNEALEAGRGVTFEQMVIAIEAGGLVDVVEHPNKANYPRQQVFVVAFEGYAYLVPFVEEDDPLLLEDHHSEPKGNPGVSRS